MRKKQHIDSSFLSQFFIKNTQTRNGNRFFSMEHKKKTLIKKTIFRVKSEEELKGKPQFPNRSAPFDWLLHRYHWFSVRNAEIKEYKSKGNMWLTCAPALFAYLPKKCPAAHRGLVLLNLFVHHPLGKRGEKKIKAKCTVLFYDTGEYWFQQATVQPPKKTSF